MPLSFKPIDLKRQKDYCRHLRHCGQVASDYSIINLWGWADEYQLKWAWHDDLVWLRQGRPFEALWAPVGAWDRTDWTTALTMARQACPRIIRIPDRLMDLWQQFSTTPLHIHESRDHWDYLYTLEDLRQLRGNRYHKKKNLVNQFKKKYDFTYRPFGPEMVTQALAMQNDWCTWRDCESHDTLAAENRVIARALNNYQAFDHITGGALEVDNTLVAYTIAESLPDNTLLIHFEKGNPDYKGSYQAINQIFLENEPGEHTLVNREQDLGNEGLRKAKLSYHPVDYVRKFEVVISKNSMGMPSASKSFIDLEKT